jgi:hypothetical protein
MQFPQEMQMKLKMELFRKSCNIQRFAALVGHVIDVYALCNIIAVQNVAYEHCINNCGNVTTHSLQACVQTSMMKTLCVHTIPSEFPILTEHVAVCLRVGIRC